MGVGNMDYITSDGILIETVSAGSSDTRLALMRRLAGYSQATLAAKAGVSLRTLQQYENHSRDINKASGQTLYLLARALQCPIDSILELDIDKVTDCIIHRDSGMEYATAYEKVHRNITKAEAENDIRHGWNFNWHQIQQEGYEIIELYTPHDNRTQGRISFKKDNGFFIVDHVENAPINVGNSGQYEGVGANLFAIVCLLSKQAGFDGWVCFNSKKDPKVMQNYIDKLHAKQIGHSQRMILDSAAAKYLIEKYGLEKKNGK